MLRETDFKLGENLIDYVNLLRLLGMRISSAEILDAFRGLEEINLAGRNNFKAVLKCSLVKRQEDLELFELAFDSFFAPSEQKQQWELKRAQEQIKLEQELAEADHDLAFQGQCLNLSQQEKLAYHSLEPVMKEKLQDFLKKSSEGKNVGQNFKPIIESLVKGQLNYLQNKFDLNLLSPGTPQTGNLEMDYLLERVYGELNQERPELIYKDMQNISEADLPEAIRIIHHLSRKLATRISRRYRFSSKRAVIDLRKSIRKNLGAGGAMLRLSYKAKKVTKPQIILVCDVSGSMSKYTNFILQFAVGLSSAVGKIETFVFAERLERVTPWLQKGVVFDEIASKIISGRYVWGQGTDLDQSLEDFSEFYRYLLTKNSILMIVSDTKSVAVSKAVEKLQTFREKVKKIIWLNTLAQKSWEKHSSVAAFQPLCKMYECNTIKGLENIIRHQLLD